MIFILVFVNVINCGAVTDIDHLTNCSRHFLAFNQDAVLNLDPSIIRWIVFNYQQRCFEINSHFFSSLLVFNQHTILDSNAQSLMMEVRNLLMELLLNNYLILSSNIFNNDAIKASNHWYLIHELCLLSSNMNPLTGLENLKTISGHF